jgi:hypothetical protein
VGPSTPLRTGHRALPEGREKRRQAGKPGRRGQNRACRVHNPPENATSTQSSSRYYSFHFRLGLAREVSTGTTSTDGQLSEAVQGGVVSKVLFGQNEPKLFSWMSFCISQGGNGLSGGNGLKNGLGSFCERWVRFNGEANGQDVAGGDRDPFRYGFRERIGFGRVGVHLS